MYQLAKLSDRSRNFIVRLASEDYRSSLVFNLALARLLANKLPLPTSEVDDLKSYFRFNLLIGINSQLSVINELLVVNTEQVAALVCDFYAHRYYNTHPCSAIVVSEKYAVEDFFGLRVTFSDGIFEAIKANPTKVAVFNNELHCLLEDLFKVEE